MQKEELKKIAQEVAKGSGKDVVYVTADGQPFFSEHYAKLNASTKGIKMHTFDFSKDEAADDNAETTESKSAKKTSAKKATKKSTKATKKDNGGSATTTTSKATE